MIQKKGYTVELAQTDHGVIDANGTKLFYGDLELEGLQILSINAAPRQIVTLTFTVPLAAIKQSGNQGNQGIDDGTTQTGN